MYKVQGAIGVQKAIVEFLEKGYEVLEPVVDIHGYDILAFMGGMYTKIQCKTSKSYIKNSNCIQFGCSRTVHSNSKLSAQRYKDNEVDYFYLYSPLHKDKSCLVPFNKVRGKIITIDFRDVKNHPNKNMWFEYRIKDLNKRIEGE